MSAAAGTPPPWWSLFWRAARLRCPHCGSGGIFRTLLELRDRCPGCGLRLDRGEGDYFVGAYLFNLVAVEVILFVCVAGIVALTWPSPPWELLTWVTATLTLAGCVGCYPFAKVTWLALDLALRPLSPEELQWHRDGGRVGERPLPHL